MNKSFHFPKHNSNFDRRRAKHRKENQISSISPEIRCVRNFYQSLSKKGEEEEEKKTFTDFDRRGGPRGGGDGWLV